MKLFASALFALLLVFTALSLLFSAVDAQPEDQQPLHQNPEVQDTLKLHRQRLNSDPEQYIQEEKAKHEQRLKKKRAKKMSKNNKEQQQARVIQPGEHEQRLKEGRRNKQHQQSASSSKTFYQQSMESVIREQQQKQQENKQQQDESAPPPSAQHHELLKALQENAPPGVKWAGPNLLLPGLATHLVEIELVKAWRTVVYKKESSNGSSSNENDTASSSSSSSSSAIRVANVTHWEVMGSVLIALYGEAEPELVQQFLRSTLAAYRAGGREMKDGFKGLHPLSRDSKATLGGKYTTFVADAALPPELQRLESSSNNNDDENNVTLTKRPPWAPVESARWVCSTVQRPSLVHFSLFDGLKAKNKKQQQQEQQPPIDAETQEILDYRGDDELRKFMKKIWRQMDRGGGAAANTEDENDDNVEPPELLHRLGSLVHRSCTGRDDDAEKLPTSNASVPFTFYAIGSRKAPQLLRTEELLDQAMRAKDEPEPEADPAREIKPGTRRRTRRPTAAEFRTKVHALHKQCRADRVFGQIVSGFPHVARLLELPHHRPLFARDHFLNRTRSKSKSKSLSKSRSNIKNDDDSSSSNNNDDDRDISVFFDDHEEEYFSPFLEGVPMQHVAVSRATVYPFRSLDSFLRARSSSSAQHYDPSSARLRTPPPANEEEERQQQEEQRETWSRFGFGRSVAAYDLDSDVRYTRANFAMTCPREREAAMNEFEELRQTVAKLEEDDDDDGGGRDADVTAKSLSSRLAYLLEAVEHPSNSAKKAAINNASSSLWLFERFVRFTGGAPIGPNMSLVSHAWKWSDKAFHSAVQTALQHRVASHPTLRNHKREVLRRRRQRKIDAMKKAAGFAGVDDKNKNQNKKKSPQVSVFEERRARLLELRKRGTLSEAEYTQELKEMTSERERQAAREAAQAARMASASGEAMNFRGLGDHREDDDDATPPPKQQDDKQQPAAGGFAKFGKVRDASAEESHSTVGDESTMSEKPL